MKCRAVATVARPRIPHYVGHHRLSAIRGAGRGPRGARAHRQRFSGRTMRCWSCATMAPHLRRHGCSRPSTPCTKSRAVLPPPGRRHDRAHLSSPCRARRARPTRASSYQPGTRRPYGVLEWPAMLRLLEAERQEIRAIRPNWTDIYLLSARSLAHPVAKTAQNDNCGACRSKVCQNSSI